MPEAEVFAIDLNLAVIQAAERLRMQRGLHIIVASLFKLPFKKRSFDLVYSQGVIHHTFSTRAALESIATRVAPDGYLFIWVYGLDDHLVPRGATGVAARTLYAFEAVVRPAIARMPAFMRNALFGALTLAAHPLIKARVNNKASWKLVNTNHDLRDRLSPQYAHRHSYNEVFEWFTALGLDIVDVQSPAEYRKLFNRRLWGVGLTGHLPLNRERVHTEQPRDVKAVAGL
jgi:SAM-dependent methyltransferase